MRVRSRVLSLVLFLTGSALSVGHNGDVIYAINAGGEAHVDYWGVHYEKDPLTGKVGTASSYGKQLVIGRVPPEDQILYQTERYHHSTFGYDIPVDEDGDFVLVLKFCEVYFNSANKKVFDIVLNGDHTIVSDLDIFERVGRGVAHDEYISFSVMNDKLYVNGAESDIQGGMIRVEFIKGYRDNPKINALYVMKGRLEDVPKLPYYQTDSEYDEMKEREEDIRMKSRKPSGPRTPDPYSVDDTAIMLPLFVAIGAFIPLLFCLCKL
ncbi:hypothetical protein FOCC_FOCC004680 [Frankliniella occidentalis]|uniref:Malectin n=1 Tax=Frankliniella occidentalis TaxID=133901 RepID=A0A6J1SVV3_FRAOC|nr:malectin [Frankliniella occidentalis]KAE8748667.1 hypothetical protein FOCC_FOCC004680 [Frankliniella occidentalis]